MINKLQFEFSPFVKQCLVTAAVCSSNIGHGANTGYPAVLLPQLQAPGSPIPMSDEQASWFTSVQAILQLLGIFIAMRLMDGYGRRLALLLVSVPGVAGWLLTAAWPTTFTQIFIGRILTSLAFGLSLPIRSVIVGEYTSPKYRGAFLSTLGLTHASGIFLVHLVGSVLGWKMTALLTTFFPLLSLLVTTFCPESPSYLASKGKFDECRKAFRWLRGDSENKELEELINARMKLNQEEKLNGISDVLHVVKKKEFYKPMIAMSHAFAMLQFCGAPAMAAYSTLLIKHIVGDVNNINFWMVQIDAQRIVCSVLAIFIIYKIKRRLMTFTTGSLCVISHISIALYVALKEKGVIDKDNSWIGLLLLNIQFVSVGLGMVNMPNIFLGEVFPLRFRSLGNTAVNVVSSICNFILLKTLPSLLQSIYITGTYYLYAGLLMYYLAVLWVFVPETKDKTLQQIEDEYRRVATKSKIEEKENYLTRF